MPWPAEDAARTLEIVLGIDRSAKENRTVVLQPIKGPASFPLRMKNCHPFGGTSRDKSLLIGWETNFQICNSLNQNCILVEIYKKQENNLDNITP